MEHLSIENVIAIENPQDYDENDSVLDKVIDPCTEFQLQYTTSDNTPSVAFNLPKSIKRHSHTTIKQMYKVDNELPRVHQIAMFNNENDLNYFPYYNDRLETASNISLSSNLTTSNVSSVSDLTGYEEELCQIKKLLIHGSKQSLYQSNFERDYNSNDLESYEIKITELEAKLNETLSENEKYKFCLNDLENKLELIWQEKYQTVLRQNAQNEGELLLVKKQLNDKEQLLNNLKLDNNNDQLQSELIKFEEKLNSLEKQNVDLTSKLILCSNESKQWQCEYNKLETENESLRIDMQEMKLDLDSKNSISFGLKNKITEQHIELQNNIQSKLKLNNQLLTVNTELESVRKSEKWYIDQLHACQLLKNNIQQELMSTQTNLISTTQKLETMKFELNHFKNLCEETQNKSLREKEKFIRKIKSIENDLLEQEAVLKCTQNKTQTELELNYISKRIDDVNEELALENYQEQLIDLKKTIQDQNVKNENLSKINSEYLIRLTTLQKLYNEKELSGQILENKNRDLEMKSNAYLEEIRMKNNELMELKNKISSLEVALHACNKEKQEIDQVVQNVRNDFNKFMKCYQNMKDKLEEKTKIITKFENEKQELFMENNWRVCEIEDLQHKILDVKILQAEILELKNLHNNSILDAEELQKQIKISDLKKVELETNCDHLKLQIQDLQNENENLIKSTKDVTNLENEILKLNETLQIREQQLLKQTQYCEFLNNEIEQKQQIINKLNEKLIDLKREESKITELNKKVQDANLVIEQFNILCRNSEREKHHLEQQLLQFKNATVQNQQSVEVQTNFDIDIENDHLEMIKSKLLQLISDNNNLSPNCSNKLTSDSSLTIINECLLKIFNLKQNQIEQLEASEKLNRKLKNRVMRLKNQIELDLKTLSERCVKLNDNYDEMYETIRSINECLKLRRNRIDVGVQTLEIPLQIETDPSSSSMVQEVKNLKTLLRVNEMERKEQYRRFEINNRTLLRKVKEHMRGRKVVEKNYNLTINEMNSLKVLTKRQELELNTFRLRCDEYKTTCDKLNETIIALERENVQKKIIIGENYDCLKCLEKEKLLCKYRGLDEKIIWFEKELNDKEKGITDCKKLLFNEKLQCSALKKQISSVQMCLDNANEQLNTKKIEITQLKSIIEKLEMNENVLSTQLKDVQDLYQECKQKLEKSVRELDEKTANDNMVADEIKMLSYHLHQKTLELSNVNNQLSAIKSQMVVQENNYQKTVDELKENVNELQIELDSIQNDKFFLQRLCADLKMSLQGTLNQNKILKLRLEYFENESTSKLSFDLPAPSNIDEEHINQLLLQSTLSPNKSMKNLRSCLDSLKEEMIVLQNEIILKTQNG